MKTYKATFIILVWFCVVCCEVVNLNNKCPKKYEECQNVLRSKHILVKNKGKWGLINPKGETILKTQYDTIILILNNPTEILKQFIIKEDDKYGIINYKNEYIVKPKYETISNWVENGPNGYYVKFKNKLGIISTEGMSLIPTHYDSLYYVTDKYIIASKEQNTGLIDINNKTLVQFEYKNIFDDYSHSELPPSQTKPWSILKQNNGVIKLLNSDFEEVKGTKLKNEMKKRAIERFTDPTGFSYIDSILLK